MTHPIPAPRPPVDVFPDSSARSGAVPGPLCLSCAHPSCRRGRAARLPRLGGHRAEFAREHLRAASLQARHPHLLIWFGESTLSYWIAGPSGLVEAPEPESLARLLERAPVRL